MDNVKVASVQMEHAAGDKVANFHAIHSFVEQAAGQGVKIIAFPECCITGYWFLRHLSKDELLELAEPVPAGPSTRQLLALSAQFGMTIGAGLVELGADGRLYDSYVVAMPDGQVRCHRRLQSVGSEHISSGKSYTVFDTPHGCRVGVLICHDCTIIENVRITALAGAEILIAPHQMGGAASASPTPLGQVNKALWENRHINPHAIESEFVGPKGRGWLMRWLPARAHDNGMFVMFANGVGVDDDEIRTGCSMVLDPYGRIISETCKAGDDIVIADLDASLLEKSTGRSWLRARRPELYGPLTEPNGKE
jgi:predicted amidohydrolase